MKIHYFQRYQEPENVTTANTMLLLSRFYSYSPNKFFQFMNEMFFSNSFEPEIQFDLQPRGKLSVPDASISQQSYKIVIETKTTTPFNATQLINHLNSFGNEERRVLLSLAPAAMNQDIMQKVGTAIAQYNLANNCRAVHINTTFEILINTIQGFLDPLDYEMQNILDDYTDYCSSLNLLPGLNAWKYMRMQLAGDTFDFNVRECVYYDKASRHFRPHNYLALYKGKSIRAVGKICAIISAVEENGTMKYNAVSGELTNERKQKIQLAIQDSNNYGYNIKDVEHNYFFVEKFYQTDYKKNTSGAPMGTRIFDLSQILNITQAIPTETIAKLLETQTWG